MSRGAGQTLRRWGHRKAQTNLSHDPRAEVGFAPHNPLFCPPKREPTQTDRQLADDYDWNMRRWKRSWHACAASMSGAVPAAASHPKAAAAAA